MRKEDIADIYRLTPVQEGMLFHTLNSPDSGVYVEQMVRTHHQKVDFDLMAKAWQGVVDRQHVLKSSFHWENLKNPQQFVHKKAELEIIRQNFDFVSEQDKQEKIEAILKEERRTGFELGKPPLMRNYFLTYGDTQTVIINYHHLLMDGWSFYLVFEEVMGLYVGLNNGKLVDLPEPVPFKKYLSWLAAQDISRAESYWKKTLADFNTPTPLPFGRKGLGENPVPMQFEMGLNSAESEALREFARSQGLTLNTLFQAAWALLLQTYTGEDDVVFGVVVSGRPPELDDSQAIVGMFINTLPVRATMKPDENVKDWLGGLQNQLSEVRDYEFTPLSSIGGWSQIPVGESIYNSFVAVESYPVQEFGQELAQQKDLQVVQTTNYALYLTVIPESDLLFRFTCDKNLYSAGEANDLLKRYLDILRELSRNGSGSLGELKLMGEEERERLVKLGGENSREYPGDKSVFSLLEEVVTETPETVALIHGEQKTTYKELNQRANQLAHYLNGKGVNSGARVGVCLERSLEFIVSILAIAKTGGVYVPLDPGYPAERLGFMIEDAGINLIVLSEGEGELFSDFKVDTVFLDGMRDVIEKESSENLAVPVDGGSLIYLMYTSGSTGQPKGVCIRHKSVTRLVRNTDYVSITVGDHVAHLSNVSFDAATFEIWGPLLNGATLHIYDKELVLSTDDFGKRVGADKITHLFLTVALFNRMAQEEPTIFRGLGDVMVGGEAVTPELFRRVIEAGGPRKIFNIYGPTENTTFSTCHHITDIPEGANNIPIGLPISNSTAYVLGKNQEVIPQGVPGELYVGGEGIAESYHNRSELTREKFIPDPFSSIKDAVLYRTGDLACWNEDGFLMCLGRIDDQVKIRGYRIEPGEVEVRINQFEKVKAAAVLVRERKNGEKYLAAYVVKQDGVELAADDLRSYLGKNLPDFFIPANFVFLDELPLTPNGKINRQALGDPDEQIKTTFQAPETAAEELLAGIWAEVLETDRVGRNHNFFELGGHSLTATRVVSRIRKTFKVETPIRKLFETPVLRDLAAYLDGLNQSELSEVKIPRVPRNDNLPLSFAQERLWFIEEMTPGNSAYNIPFAVVIDGPLEKEVLQKSINALISRHEILRTSFQTEDGEARQIIQDEFLLSLDFKDFSERPDSEREKEMRGFVGIEVTREFDLLGGPPIRCVLVKDKDLRHILVLTMHHIIADGWSTSVFIKELLIFHKEFLAGNQGFVLPELDIQYVDFALWQRQWLQGEKLEKQLAFWREQFADPAPNLELPLDFPRPSMQTYGGAWEPFQLSAGLTQKLEAICQNETVTLFMLLFSAFNVLLFRLTGQNDIVLGTPIANRNIADIENLIGFFVNSLPIRTKLSDTLTFQKFLAQVRNNTLSAYAHQDVPFEKIVDELGIERDISRNPLFQIMFAVHNVPFDLGDNYDLKVESYEFDWDRSHFDITFNLNSQGESIQGGLEYNTDLFKPETIQMILRLYEKVLEQISENPRIRLRDVELLNRREQTEIQERLNGPSLEYPAEAGLVRLFEEQAATNKSLEALVSSQGALTYGELNEQANQLACVLSKKGVKRGSHVGICITRSRETIISILAILKAGGVYVPLDPEYPLARLKFMTEDAGIFLVITLEQHRESFSEPGLEIICLDAEAKSLQKESDVNLEITGNGEDLAYIMYTSGSTGMPRGVAIQQKSVVRLVRNTDYVEFKPGDQVANIASVSFDASTFEIWGALLNGGTVNIYDKETVLSIHDFGHALASDKVSHMFITSAYFNQIVAEEPSTFKGIRYLLIGGDAVNAEAVRLLMESEPPQNILNGYGPTENTTFSTWFRVETVGEKDMTIPIGRALANSGAYILDKHMQLNPPGVPGELYVSGEGLAREYINRPKDTAEKFVPDPFSGKAGARLYRTGDLVKAAEDGIIQFISRIDNQVKIRGFRIEPGEVEARISELKEVKQAFVTVLEGESKEKILIGFVVKEDGVEFSEEDLKRSLGESLPDYMVPSVLIFLEELPLTPNGKINRKLLLSQGQGFLLERKEGALPEGVDPLRPPKNETEEMILKIFRKILKKKELGVYDNFFENGGHSLAASRVVARIKRKLKVKIAMRYIFESPTVAQLAAIVDITSGKTEEAAVAVGGDAALEEGEI